MNRKQVGAFLKIMSNDQVRPVLCTAYVDVFRGKTVLVTTDSYILSAVYIPDVDEDMIGKIITRKAIEIWYKLADGKSYFDSETIRELVLDDERNNRNTDMQYPKWQSIVERLEQSAVDTISFNADYAKKVQDLNGTAGLTLVLNGKLGGMVCDNDIAYSIIMPLKG